MRFWLLTCVTSLLVLPRPAFDNNCTGLGVTAEIQLICSGTCPSGSCTSREDGMDQWGTFSYCGCFEHDYDNCCTVVLRDGVARQRGTCPACGAPGQCTVLDNPGGELREPTCVEVLYPPRPILK